MRRTLYIPLLVLSLGLSNVMAWQPGALPDGPIILGYQNWAACDMNDTVTAVSSGVNVVVWFAVNLIEDSASGAAAVSGGPDYDCMAGVAAELDSRSLPTTHLISIGGWDAPHPDPAFNGSEYFAAFDAWNRALPRPFDGFDWDLEGNDNPAAASNAFTAATLNTVVDMSVAGSAAGYVVTLVPAQSYFDPSTDGFNLSLLNMYPDWHPDFAYHGLNCYAYLVAASPPGTYGLVTVQLYESWSRADQLLLQVGEAAADILAATWAAATPAGGFEVDFGDASATGLRVGGRLPVVVPPSALIVGLSRGDAGGKSAFFWPADCGAAYEATLPPGRPRGFGFWNIASEGGTVNGTNATLAFAPTLNEFLHVR